VKINVIERKMFSTLFHVFNQKSQVEEGQTLQSPREKRQKDKQRSTKHYTENLRSGNTNPIKTGENSGIRKGKQFLHQM
jgi:hypothetical protein